MTIQLSSDLIALLRSVDTPTVCNALNSIDANLRGVDYTRDQVVASSPKCRSIVGFARTARIISSQPAVEADAVIRQRRLDYYRYISEGSEPKIVVMQDCGPLAYGCNWGAVSASIHRGFGVVGALTDGAIRDVTTIPEDFQLLGAIVCPGSGFAHIKDFDQEVTVLGLRVAPGDLIHADVHGAVKIPLDLVPQLGAAVDYILRREAVILDAATAPGFTYEKFLEATVAFEAVQR